MQTPVTIVGSPSDDHIERWNILSLFLRLNIYHLSSPTIAFHLSNNPLQEPPRNRRYPSVVRPGPFRFVPHARDSSRRRRRTDSSCRRWTVGRRREDFDVLSPRPPRGPSFPAAGVLRFGGFSACISIHLVCSDWYENEQLLRSYKCMYLYLGHEYFRTRNCLVNGYRDFMWDCAGTMYSICPCMSSIMDCFCRDKFFD
jgi:hypothetical protein